MSARDLSTPTKQSFGDKCVPKPELGNENELRNKEQVSRLERKQGVATFPAMSTLTEIEAAVDKLPEQEQKALLHHLNLRLRHPAAGAEGLRDLAEFAGTICLREDPLAWQQQARSGWR